MQCITGLDDCDDGATYMWFPDGHHCVCNSWFTEDGVTCTDTHIQHSPCMYADINLNIMCQREFH